MAQSILINLENLSRNLAPTRLASCCKVPRPIRKLNEAVYTPLVVSIGPYHHGRDEYASMEDVKIKYLLKFTTRTPLTLEFLVAQIMSSEERAREHYTEKVEPDSTKFVQMLLLDGVFIFQIMLEYFYKEHTCEEDDNNIVLHPWLRRCLYDDMKLVENQLPFFILRDLYNLAKECTPTTSSSTLPNLQHIVHIYFNLGTADDDCLWTGDGHLLDVIRFHWLPRGIGSRDSAGSVRSDVSRCATKLHKAGVRIKLNGGSSSKFELKFNQKDGVLEMPYLRIGHGFERQMRNLMAYELQCYPCCTYIVDYVFFLDSLINTPEDVDLLEKHGILKNLIGSSEAVSSLINSLSQEIHLGSLSYFAPLSNELEEYCKIPKHIWMATLRRDYLSTPWRVASTIAAVILLLLTLMQTVNSFVAFFV